MTTSDESTLDDFLAHCVRESLDGRALPGWPAGLDQDAHSVLSRIAYHGIPLLLIPRHGEPNDWPEALVSGITREARLQALWEESHSRTIAPLVAALAEQGCAPLVLKGTALAYSVYRDPAVRRRGDTDLLVSRKNRDNVRAVFRDCGFQPVGERMALQESWVCSAANGFDHEVDLHWDLSASAAISQALGRDPPQARAVALPRLSPAASGTGPHDTLIHVCINRAAHHAFGYSGAYGRSFAGDRLIWAVDIYRITADFEARDWDEVIRIATSWNTARCLAQGLEFARDTLSVPVPPRVIEALQTTRSESDLVLRYFRHSNARQRLAMDLAASPSIGDKLAVLAMHALPGREFMNERYPRQTHWPLSVLRVRRMIDAGLNLLLGKAR